MSKYSQAVIIVFAVLLMDHALGVREWIGAETSPSLMRDFGMAVWGIVAVMIAEKI